MRNPSSEFTRLYQSSLRSHLAHGSSPDPDGIGEIVEMTRTTRLSTLELAKLHERFLVVDLLPHCPEWNRSSMIRNAGNFFAAVIGAGKESGGDAARLRETIGSLSGRSVELAATNQQLGREIIQREKAEAALRKSERHVQKALEKSEIVKEQLRGLSRSVLVDQEEERKKISRELHDVIAQGLVGINVRLATIKTEAGNNVKRLERNITLTQKMVTHSADIVHRYARELRPALLDDLGLIPALHSLMKSFSTRTGVRAHLTAFEGVEKISSAKRTILYRVAQEALTNVERHARAGRVDVTIRKDVRFVRMELSDDGRSFEVQTVLHARKSKPLGLLGMRERVEMVGGSLEIESAPGVGTSIVATIPVGRAIQHQWRNESADHPRLKP